MVSEQLKFWLAVLGPTFGGLVVLFAICTCIGGRKVKYRNNQRKANECKELMAQAESVVAEESRKAIWRRGGATALRGELQRLREEFEWISSWRHRWFDPDECKDRIDDLRKDLHSLLDEVRDANDTVVELGGVSTSENVPLLRRHADSVASAYSLFRDEFEEQGLFSLGSNPTFSVPRRRRVSLKVGAAMEDVHLRDIPQHYRLGPVLVSDASCTVRLCDDPNTSKMYAVKEVCRTASGNNTSHVDIMRRLKHRNIVNIYDIIMDQNKIYLVFDYVPGGEVFDFIADHGSLTEQRASQVIRDVIEAVAYLHRNNVVHGDIKPENIHCILRRWPLQIKLCESGLTGDFNPKFSDAFPETQSPPCSPGFFLAAVKSTPIYSAPEVICKKQLGPAIDMWAVGVVLYILLSGRMPFRGRTDVDTLRFAAKGTYSFPEREWANISEDAKSLVNGLLEVEPEKRLTAEAALHHRWIDDNQTLCTEPIGNNLCLLHSRVRKFQKVARAVFTINRIRQLYTNFRTNGPESQEAPGNATRPFLRVRRALRN